MPRVEDLLFPVILFAALGCGLMAGLFFTFSNFVMKALARIDPYSGIAGMQKINVAILNPLFLAIFLGTAAACLLLTIYSIVRWQNPGTVWLLGGGALYLLGTLGVTIAFHVPRNEALARVDASSSEGVRAWRDYVPAWIRWNHVRTITALAATASFIIALRQLAAVPRWGE
jgi:uncharacterized membrane protein